MGDKPILDLMMEAEAELSSSLEPPKDGSSSKQAVKAIADKQLPIANYIYAAIMLVIMQ